MPIEFRKGKEPPKTAVEADDSCCVSMRGGGMHDPPHRRVSPIIHSPREKKCAFGRGIGLAGTGRCGCRDRWFELETGTWMLLPHTRPRGRCVRPSTAYCSKSLR